MVIDFAYSAIAYTVMTACVCVLAHFSASNFNLTEWNGFRKTLEKSISVLTAAMPEHIPFKKTTLVNKVLLDKYLDGAFKMPVAVKYKNKDMHTK